MVARLADPTLAMARVAKVGNSATAQKRQHVAAAAAADAAVARDPLARRAMARVQTRTTAKATTARTSPLAKAMATARQSDAALAALEAEPPRATTSCKGLRDCRPSVSVGMTHATVSVAAR